MEPEQWSVQFTDADFGVLSRPPANEALRLWQERGIENELTATRERPVHPAANWSGEWWSNPTSALTTSTRALQGLGPVGLWLIEDGFGWTQADSQRVNYEGVSRIYEISGVDSWAELCREYPLGVTSTRRHDWYRSTGRKWPMGYSRLVVGLSRLRRSALVDCGIFVLSGKVHPDRRPGCQCHSRMEPGRDLLVDRRVTGTRHPHQLDA